MSQLSLTLLRLGFLALLWALVLTAVAVLRADIYGTRVFTRGRGRTNTRAATRSAPPARATTGVAPTATPGSGVGKPRLAVVAGPLKGTTIPLESAAVVIGRSPRATLVIEDDYCSARHVRVFLEGDVWMVEDLGSTNGTFLDDAKLTEPNEFEVGSRIRLGATAIEMRD